MMRAHPISIHFAIAPDANKAADARWSRTGQNLRTGGTELTISAYPDRDSLVFESDTWKADLLFRHRRFEQFIDSHAGEHPVRRRIGRRTLWIKVPLRDAAFWLRQLDRMTWEMVEREPCECYGEPFERGEELIP